MSIEKLKDIGGRDREKMDPVLETASDKNIVIVEKEQYERFLGVS